MKNLFNVISGISGVLLILAILIQSQGQSLGASFGGDSSFHRSKRGAELVVFNATVVLAVIFVLTIILGLLAKK